jgi:hypothetical protein
MFSIILVFNSRSDSRHNSLRFEIFWLLFTVKLDLTSIPEVLFWSCWQIQAWPFPSLFYQFLLPNLELLVGLNLLSNPWVSFYDQVLSIGTPNESIQPYHIVLPLRWDCWSHIPESYCGSSRSENWWFNAWASPSDVVFRYRAFLLNSLKFDGMNHGLSEPVQWKFVHCIISWASHHHAKASMHKHRFTSAFLTLSKSVDTQYHLECILGDLVASICSLGLF